MRIRPDAPTTLLRRFPLLLALALTLVAPAAAVITTAAPAQAGLGAGDFLKADGTVLRRASGTGDVVTLRGTNLGGWLTYEDWMSPLGEFALGRAGWAASASLNSGTATAALDGDGATRWTTGTGQANGQWFQVDLGSPTLFNRIYLDAAGFTGTAPVSYRVQVSSDGATWKDVASGPGGAQLLSVPFSPQIARYVRVAQTGSAAAHWSIAEFNLFADPVLHNGPASASASATAGGHSPAMAIDGDVNTRWTSGSAQTPGQTFTIDLGGIKPVNKVLVDAGPDSAGDYPRGYELLTSPDGVNWSKVASDYASTRIMVLELFTTAHARYLRLVQTGSSTNWWSIAEVAITSEGTFDRTGWTITASSTEPGGSAANLKDGNPGTRWSSGAAQTGGEWLQVDLGATQTFNQIVMSTAKNSAEENDYPRGYTVQVSADASTWTTVATGAGSEKATPINFPAARGRYFRITQTGSSGSWWSVGELTAALNNDDYSMNLAYQQRFGPATTETIINRHQQTWITESDLNNLQAMGMNLIRLPIGWTELRNLDGTWKSDPWSMIDWLVAEASERNMYVLFDLHTVPGGGCPWGSCGRIGPNPNGFWTNFTYQDWVIDIWEAIATRYEGNPAVAGYDLINEPLLDYGEDADDIGQKSAYYDRLYDAVRAIDPDHVIVIAGFFGWNSIAPPAQYGWTNVMYELHPYDFPGGKDHDAQESLVNTQLADVAAKINDPTWSVPVLYGEYSLYHYDDVWAKFMGGLNARNVSWTNWNYKVRGDHYNGAGGYWGFYNSNPNPVPIINNDIPATIMAKTDRFATTYFQPNTTFINVVSRFTGGQPWLATIPLDQTGWTATASSTEAGGSPANALDWNPNTRWSTGAPQAAGQWFQVNLGTKRVFDQISFETRGDQRWDYPRGYQIQVSNDGTNWTTVRSGKGWGWKQALPFAPQYAQYVRVAQTSTGPDWWSIAEFHVYGTPALNRTGWTVSASVTGGGSSAGNAVDASLTTRWTTGTGQAAGQYFQADLGKAQPFHRILLDSSGAPGDYPRGYQIQVSPDASNWTTVHTGNGTGPVVLAEFAAQFARYVRLVLTASSSSWWSIHDLQVYGELERDRSGWSVNASVTGAGSSAGNAIDGDLGTRWTTGTAQAAGQWYSVDLGAGSWFNHVVIDAGTGSPGDHPRRFNVETSNDGSNWTTIATGYGTSQVTTVNVPITQARYLRVRLTGGTGNWWSIAELRVFE
ncbi:discoidin domain-containing protein [Micromonospora thermarum]|uniref:Exo-1,3-beta-glucanase D n=1 Tax=Micromonospora thermarum TaxID=2720024 RepID=A0ABX0ZFQ2_9ACTN|nr:discoidin domain-containing protein [Micromonospora thermarum]NJP35389.1 cellulase family glycosylhydrolase [Micromonospora thermarum]